MLFYLRAGFNAIAVFALRHVEVHGALTDALPSVTPPPAPESRANEQISVNNPTFHKVNVHGVTEG